MERNYHLAGHCKDFLRLVDLAYRATDRASRRAQHNDTIQDIRLQRQARNLGFSLLHLAQNHESHDYTTHPSQ